MTRVAVPALAVGLVLLAVGCGAARKHADPKALRPAVVSPVPVLVDLRHAASRGPFVPGPAFFPLGTTDGIDTLDGQITSCVPGQRYAQVIDVRNRSNSTLTLIGATGRHERAARVFPRVATQLRLESRPHGMGLGGNITYSRGWSSARTRPVAIPAGRSAIIQSNFRMARCNDLAGGRTLVIPGELFLLYRSGGKTRAQTIDVPDSRIVLTQGAAQHDCGPRIVGGSSSVLAANMSCRVAQQAARACQRVGTCKSDGKVWDCLGGGCWVHRNEAEWLIVRSRRGP